MRHEGAAGKPVAEKSTLTRVFKNLESVIRRMFG